MSASFEPYATEIQSALNEDSFFDCFHPLTDFTEQEADWAIPGWLPRGQVAVLAGDGGTGKTSWWVHIVSAFSRGGACLLDPPGYVRDPANVAFLTTEDSVSKKLKKRLREAGADESRIITMDLTADKTGALRNFKFGTEQMAAFIRHFRPALCVFDPLQGFLPPSLNMGSRNEMRNCLSSLIGLGEEVGTTFMIICHTNKRTGASGRARIADSADLWDLARSVLVAGHSAEEGVFYLSQEKSNYDRLQETVLFSIDDNGQIHFEGTTSKRDREFQNDLATAVARPNRDEAKNWILNRLADVGELRIKDLETDALAAGFSSATIKRAKAELKNSRQISFRAEGFGSEKTWLISPSPPPQWGG